MKHRFLSIVLALTLALGLVLPASSATASQSDWMHHTLEAGSQISAYINEKGELFTCGGNLYRQLGYEATNDSYSGTDIQTTFQKVMDDAVAVSVGGSQVAAIQEDGSLWMWGSNGQGQLGIAQGNSADGKYQTVPRKVMDHVAMVSCGSNFTGAVKTDGSLWMWGSEFNGVLGNGQGTDSYTTDGNPVPQKILDDVAMVSCGSNCAAAIQTDGSLWVWGSNTGGVLGFEGGSGGSANYPYQDVPRKIMDSGAAYVACGNCSIALLKTDGSLWTWGSNGEGELGNGSQETTTTPQKILDGVSFVSASHYDNIDTMCALKEDGSLWVWGSNSSGYLGFDSHNSTAQTVPFKLMNDVAQVSTGGIHTIAIKEDGSLWAWGYNNYGQQGRGSNVAGVNYLPSKVLDNVRSTQSQTEEQVTVSSWAQADVSAAQAAGIVPEGLPTDYTKGITRAQFCHLGVALYETVTGTEIAGRTPFVDTTDVDVQKMASLGVVSGVGNNKFNPDSTITRQEAASILARLAEATGVRLTEVDTPFTDTTSGWALSGIAKVYGAGIMTGTSGTTFSPLGTYTIEQSVATMFRLYEIAPDREPTPTPTPTATPTPTPEPSTEPTLANGQPITEANVLAIINGLRSEYPEEMPWTNANSYYSPAVHLTGYGCAGFALICSDAAFGDLPVTSRHSNFDAIKVGDMLRINHDTHSVVVLEKRADSVIVTEGNYNSSIHWDREISRQSLEDGNYQVTTRYPQ